MNTLLKTYWDEGRIDLLKLDIEGGEQELLGSIWNGCSESTRSSRNFIRTALITLDWWQNCNTRLSLYSREFGFPE